jgi:hypothetical protein
MRFVPVALSLLLLGASPALGQTGQPSQLRVTVVDQTGASIPAAHVVVTNEAGFTAQGDVDQRGQVTLPGLPMGPVRLHIESAGFSPYDATVTLRRGNNNQTVTLGIAGLQEEIVVSDTANSDSR